MDLNYANLPFDRNGRPEMPELMLRTRGDEAIGIISGVSNLKLHVKFAEPSELTFDVAAVIDGQDNPLYDRISGHKIVYTEHYGVYLLMNPETESDGISEIKHVTGYSLEKELETKRMFLEEGTYRFYGEAYVDSGGVTHNDSILGRVLECAPGWSVKTVAPAVAQRYRTFDQYDDYLLPFLYNEVKKAFRCVFVFDTYDRTISVLDADAELEQLPIYLDHDNLLQTVDINEISEELVTAIRPYGADGVSILNVNPIGSSWMYDLSYFIENGDIPKQIADRWLQWQQSVIAIQPYYNSLCALNASAQAKLLAARSQLTELENELSVLTAQQSVIIQSIAIQIESSSALEAINERIRSKEREIANQESAVNELERLTDENDSGSYAARIKALAASYNVKNVFGADYDTLSRFFIEQDITEETFVATTVDSAANGTTLTLSGAGISISDCDIQQTVMDEFQKDLYMFSGGTMAITGAVSLSCDVIRGTLEVGSDRSFVMSLYAGTIRHGSTSAPSGMIVLSGQTEGISGDIHEDSDGGVAQMIGTRCALHGVSGPLYVTFNVSDYQQYAVEMELYEYGANLLAELSSPTYEFTVSSGNPIFAQEFKPFRDALALGKGVYLRVSDKRVIKPYIIELELDFEDESSFSMVFSGSSALRVGMSGGRGEA